MYDGNVKICQPKSFLLLPLLIIVFLHQLNGMEIQILFSIYRKLLKTKNATYIPPSRIRFFDCFLIRYLVKRFKF